MNKTNKFSWNYVFAAVFALAFVVITLFPVKAEAASAYKSGVVVDSKGEESKKIAGKYFHLTKNKNNTCSFSVSSSANGKKTKLDTIKLSENDSECRIYIYTNGSKVFYQNRGRFFASVDVTGKNKVTYSNAKNVPLGCVFGIYQNRMYFIDGEFSPALTCLDLKTKKVADVTYGDIYDKKGNLISAYGDRKDSFDFGKEKWFYVDSWEGLSIFNIKDNKVVKKLKGNFRAVDSKKIYCVYTTADEKNQYLISYTTDAYKKTTLLKADRIGKVTSTYCLYNKGSKYYKYTYKTGKKTAISEKRYNELTY